MKRNYEECETDYLIQKLEKLTKKYKTIKVELKQREQNNLCKTVQKQLLDNEYCSDIIQWIKDWKTIIVGIFCILWVIYF
jgi:hypothetical protein